MKTHPLFDVALPLAFAGTFVFACTESMPEPSNNIVPSAAQAPEGPEAGVITTDAPAPIAQAEPAVLDTFVLPAPQTLLEREALKPTDVGEDHVAIGQRHLKDKNAAEAVLSFRRALSLEDNPDTWAALGTAYLKSGDQDRALDCLEEAVSRDIDNAAVRTTLARTYLDRKNGEEVVFHAKVLVEQGERASGHYLLGRGYMAQSMWQEAVDAMTVVIEEEPDNVYAFNNLGYAALQIGDNVRAVDALETILDLDGQKGYMLNNLGLAYAREGRTVEAYAAFARALEIKPGYINAKLNQDRVKADLSEQEVELALDVLEDLKTPIAEQDVLAASMNDAAEPPEMGE